MFNMILLFIFSIMLYLINYKNILLLLISLEFMMINTIYSMYTIMKMLNINLYFTLIFLTLAICEGILGLTIMVYMIRNSGNDYLTLMNLMKW